MGEGLDRAPQHFDDGKLTLTLLFGDAQALLPQLVATVDAVFLDGFAPSRNPELWSPALLTSITHLCKSQATLATWSVASEVRRTLQKAGWKLERRPGFGGKREMLVGELEIAVPPAPTIENSPRTTAGVPGLRHSPAAK